MPAPLGLNVQLDGVRNMPRFADWGDDPTATINSVTERNDRTRVVKELLAVVDSGAVDNVLPKSVCTEYILEATSKSQSGVGCKGAKG